MGDTTVNCTAEDAAGNTGNASFMVTVEDDEDPTWSVPPDITVIAAGLSGAVVSYTATAADNVGVTSESCSPASGSAFSLGTTTVNCAATDAAGNTGKASFTVTVAVDQGSVDTLIDEIKAMNLPNGVENSLIGPIKNATKLLEDNKPANDKAVCNKLDSFLSHVQDELAANNITQTQADLMSAFAQAIKNELSCP